MLKLIIALGLVSDLAIATSTSILAKDIDHEKYASIHYLSRTKSEISFNSDQRRTHDFPTQIVRLNLDLSDKKLSCGEWLQ